MGLVSRLADLILPKKRTVTLPDGRKYVGELQNGKYHGQGIATWPDGRKYVGGFRNNARHCNDPPFSAQVRPLKHTP